MKFNTKIIILVLTLITNLSVFSNEKIQKWSLDEVKSNPGAAIMQLKAFPEYFRIQRSKDLTKGILIVKMRNQMNEKKYKFKLSESTMAKTVQTYGNKLQGFFAANETAILDYEDDKIIVSLKWTRDDKNGWKTSNEYSVTFEKDGTIRFLRINGKNSEATYLEFEAIYKMDQV